MKWAAQGGGGVLIPRGVQGITGCGIQCSRLGDKVGIGHRLDSVILEVFSKLNESLIIRRGFLPDFKDPEAVLGPEAL